MSGPKFFGYVGFKCKHEVVARPPSATLKKEIGGEQQHMDRFSPIKYSADLLSAPVKLISLTAK